MTPAETAADAESDVTCPAVGALATRILAELADQAAVTGPGAGAEHGPEFLAGLWEALRVASESRYGVTNSSRPGAAAAGWDVIDRWTGEVVEWTASRRDADDLTAEQGALNAAEYKAALLTQHEQDTG